ncbi:MAG: penicillin-binding protein 2 [Clostridia bacterium]|nr:penicillin-binding protein 2 [Clostridia bacterium]
MQISYKRVAVCYFLVVILLFICAFRVFSVMNKEDYKQTAEQISSRVINLEYSRGTIFDCNMNPITNAKEVYNIVIFNKPTAISALYKHFSGSEIEKIISELNSNGFAVRKISREISADGIYCVKAYSHADDSLLAKHIVGYTDISGKGLCGLESSFNEILFCADQNKISFSINGQGSVISGYKPQVTYNSDIVKSGVKITLDKEIQRIAEQEAMKINSGAVVVCEILTGKIKALVSRPDYKLSDLAAALENEQEPLLNRTLCNYNIGSVFKPLIAAVGLENNLEFSQDCKGYTNIDGLNFTCHNLGGHGVMNLKDAIKYSCNSFFYNFVQLMEPSEILNMAQKAGINSRVILSENLYTAKGSFGSVQNRTPTKRELANLSIGQGELLTSPLAITNLYMAIAADGYYRMPSLIEGIVEDGVLKEENVLPARTKLFSKTTASALKEYLTAVLEEDGTGKNAKPTLTTAAGKTGTAQTGVIKNGKKVTNSWFCGFFPLEKPKYAVTVLSENAQGGCGDIFAAIADAVTLYEAKDNGN